jgi:hypothetical protein
MLGFKPLLFMLAGLVAIRLLDIVGTRWWNRR